MLSIRNSAAIAYDSLSTNQIDSPKNMIRKLEKLALPITSLAGMQQLQGIDVIRSLGCLGCIWSGGSMMCVPICTAAIVTILLDNIMRLILLPF
jgi:hypothetical protein